jgi:lysozyme
VATRSAAIDRAKPIIRQWEGLRTQAYRCPGGYLTIGYGHRMESGDCQECTPDEAEIMLEADCNRAWREVARLSPWLTDNQAAALVSFIFNVGAENFRGSTMARLIASHELERASKEFARWCWSRAERLPGLVSRRAAEAELFAK